MHGPMNLKQNALNSQIYFWNRTLHVLDRFPVHHQESSTVYTAIGIFSISCDDFHINLDLQKENK